MNYAIAVDGGRHLPVMIALILNNTRHVKTTTAGLSNGDGLRCPLVGVDTAEEQQVAAAFRIEREVLKPDAVMDRGGIGQGRVSIRLADGDIRSEENTSELQSIMRTSYPVFSLK